LKARLKARQGENEPKNCNQRDGWQDPTYIAWRKPIDFNKLLAVIEVHFKFWNLEMKCVSTQIGAN
jgi:hypothetical protein